MKEIERKTMFYLTEEDQKHQNDTMRSNFSVAVPNDLQIVELVEPLSLNEHEKSSDNLKLKIANRLIACQPIHVFGVKQDDNRQAACQHILLDQFKAVGINRFCEGKLIGPNMTF